MRPLAVLVVSVRKELRDVRSVLLGIPVVVTGALLLLGLVLPRDPVVDPVFPLVTAAGCLALWLFGIASELVPGESRRGTLAFLARLPSGLGAPFAAKVVVLVSTGILLAGFGYAAGSLAGGAFGTEFEWPSRGGFSALAALKRSEDLWGLLLLGIVVICAWTFAASCWVPRGRSSTTTASCTWTPAPAPW